MTGTATIGKKYRDADEAWAVYERQSRNAGITSGVRHGRDEEGEFWYLGHEVDPYDAPIRSKTTLGE